MKLRIKGNSLRLRITPSEMTRLLETGRIDETIYFASGENAHLTYALEHAPGGTGLQVRYSPGEIAVVVSSAEARRWAGAADGGHMRRSQSALEFRTTHRARPRCRGFGADRSISKG